MDLGPVLTPVRDLGEFIRDQRTQAQISLRQLAAKAGVSNPYLSQVERGLRKPSADILAQIAQGLQISVESLLTKAGILEHGDNAPAVVVAVNADPLLTERQKASLLEIYTSFCREAAAAAASALEQATADLNTDLAVADEAAEKLAARAVARTVEVTEQVGKPMAVTRKPVAVTKNPIKNTK